jgi:hypothetical protein
MSVASTRRRRRITQPADQAKVTCFLASSDADFVSAVTIDVTGGQ